MNTGSPHPTGAAPPPRCASFSCNRHPDEHFSVFCPTCLRERLVALEHTSVAVKYISTSATNAADGQPPLPKPPKPRDRRRSGSFSASKNDASCNPIKPPRKSCDVRVRSNDLWPRFAQNKSGDNYDKKIELDTKEDLRNTEGIDVGRTSPDDDSDGEEIGPVRDFHLDRSRKVAEVDFNSVDIVEEEAFNLKPMKYHHTDLETEVNKGSRGGFWTAASAFGKKWRNWRPNLKMKKQSNGGNPIPQRCQEEAHFEVADYGFGRRSCDTNPRLWIDAGRNDHFEEPRASWDGYLIERSCPRMLPMVPVLEDGPTRSGMRIGVNEDDSVPGGSVQTKEYYLASSSSRRRKGTDQSNLIRKGKMDLNSKVLPADTADHHFLQRRVIVRERYLRDLPENFELGSQDRCSADSMTGIGQRKESKKSWNWRVWGGRNGVGNENGVNWLEKSREWNSRFNANVIQSNSNHVRHSLALEKRRSVRYAPNYLDNGLLRFYLMPTRRRPGCKNKSKNHWMYN